MLISTFVIEWGSLKSERKRTVKEGGSGLSVRFHCEKNRLHFQTANTVLSDKLLDSCLKFCCLQPNPAYKGVGIFFNLMFFCEFVNIFIVIVYITV